VWTMRRGERVRDARDGEFGEPNGENVRGAEP